MKLARAEKELAQEAQGGALKKLLRKAKKPLIFFTALWSLAGKPETAQALPHPPAGVEQAMTDEKRKLFKILADHGIQGPEDLQQLSQEQAQAIIQELAQELERIAKTVLTDISQHKYVDAETHINTLHLLALAAQNTHLQDVTAQLNGALDKQVYSHFTNTYQDLKTLLAQGKAGTYQIKRPSLKRALTDMQILGEKAYENAQQQVQQLDEQYQQVKTRASADQDERRARITAGLSHNSPRAFSIQTIGEDRYATYTAKGRMAREKAMNLLRAKVDDASGMNVVQARNLATAYVKLP